MEEEEEEEEEDDDDDEDKDDVAEEPSALNKRERNKGKGHERKKSADNAT